MATKRPKKKKTDKKKKVIEVTFDTPMSKFANPIIAMQQRDLFYQKLSTEQMNELLIQLGIMIDADSIVKEIVNTTFDDTLSRLYRLYEPFIEQIDAKHIILNSDLLIEYLERLMSYIDPCDLADAEYLDEAFEYAKTLRGREYFEYMLRIMKSANRLKDHYPTRNVEEICEPTMLDLEGELFEFYGMELGNTLLDYDIARDDQLVIDLINELDTFVNEMEVTHFTAGILLENKVLSNLLEDDSLLYALCKRYPDDQIDLYFHYLIGLYDLKADKDIVDKYYQEALALPVLNDNEKKSREQLIDLFEDYDHILSVMKE